MRRRIAAATVAAAALALGAPVERGVSRAEAERVQSGDIVMSLRGGLMPLRLPRQGVAPAAATLTSAIGSADGGPVPRVRRIEVAFGAGARLSVAGLPVCPWARLRNATHAEALRRCGGALVGRGSLPLEVHLPGQLPFRRAPRALLFNGRGRGGGIALWLHVATVQPPASFVMPFDVRRGAGSWGTVLVGSPPASLGWARLRGFELALGRRYREDGRVRGYLSASCPVPRPFTAGFFSFARATYSFAGGRRLSNTIVRSCRVAP